MEYTPAHPNWQHLKELLDECSTSNNAPVPEPENEKEPAPSKNNISVPNYKEEAEHDYDTNKLINRIKKLEETIKEQNQIIRVKNAYINVLEQKLKKLKEKQILTEDTTGIPILDNLSSNFDLDEETEVKNPIEKIADLHQYLQSIHEQVRQLKKRTESQ
ncbi:MAG TPA: hypothetical protein PLA12_10520 [Candidatus Hydrogenedens sp.]|nr:hypothetical protein [Candidatus Hydrogenedens sp.]